MIIRFSQNIAGLKVVHFFRIRGLVVYKLVAYELKSVMIDPSNIP